MKYELEALNSAPIAIMWKDADGKYLGMNKHALEMFGFSDIVGKTDHDPLPRRARKPLP